MPLAAIDGLTDWGDFYVIIGAAAGVLIGLMFVVVALTTESLERTQAATEAYGTPTVVHFATVLFVSGLITVPKQTDLSLALCLIFLGVGGLVYTAWVILQARKISNYADYFSDWIWRSWLPAASYVSILIAAGVIFADAAFALYIVAATSLILLFAGIHNAWDTAVWIATDHDETPQ